MGRRGPRYRSAPDSHCRAGRIRQQSGDSGVEVSEQITEQDLHRFADLINSSDSGELSDAVVENGVLYAKTNAGHLIGAREAAALAAALAVEEAADQLDIQCVLDLPTQSGRYAETGYNDHFNDGVSRVADWLSGRAQDIRDGKLE